MNIFIDTEDMEERYAEGLYKDYLEEQNKQLQQERDKYKSIVDKAIKYIEETPIGRILPVHYWQEKDYTEPLLKILKELEEGNSNENNNIQTILINV